MTMRSHGPAFISASRPARIQGFDLARAVAVMAMVVINYTSLMEIGTFSPKWMDQAVDFLFGRAATVFIILSGISIALIFNRSAADASADAIRRYLTARSLLMLLAGVLLWHWWAADILHFYAVYIALGMILATTSNRRLRQLLIVIVLLSMPICAALTVAYDFADRNDVFEGQGAVLRLAADYLTSRYYPLLPWFGYFLLGILLGRREMSGRVFYGRLFLVSLFACLAIELFSSAMLSLAERYDLEIECDWRLAFLRSEAFPATPLFVLSSAASGVALISFCRLAADAYASSPILASVCSFGKLSLTLYIGHLLLGFGVVAWVEGHGGRVGPTGMLAVAALFCLAGIFFATSWCRRFKRGPLESLFYRISRLAVAPPVRRPPLAKGERLRSI